MDAIRDPATKTLFQNTLCSTFDVHLRDDLFFNLSLTRQFLFYESRSACEEIEQALSSTASLRPREHEMLSTRFVKNVATVLCLFMSKV